MVYYGILYHVVRADILFCGVILYNKEKLNDVYEKVYDAGIGLFVYIDELSCFGQRDSSHWSMIYDNSGRNQLGFTVMYPAASHSFGSSPFVALL